MTGVLSRLVPEFRSNDLSKSYFFFNQFKITLNENNLPKKGAFFDYTKAPKKWFSSTSHTKCRTHQNLRYVDLLCSFSTCRSLVGYL
jgi:hypothetical protein